MKKLILSLLVIAAFVVAPMSLFAQNPTDVATATGSASVISPIDITQVTNLDFGIISNSTGGTVTILAIAGAQANPTTTGGLSVISTSAPLAASFSVAGSGNATYAIDIDPTLTLAGQGAISAESMTSTLYLDANKPGAVGTLSSGTDNIYVGGVLTVGATQAAGAYIGSFDVTINYN